MTSCGDKGYSIFILSSLPGPLFLSLSLSPVHWIGNTRPPTHQNNTRTGKSGIQFSPTCAWLTCFWATSVLDTSRAGYKLCPHMKPISGLFRVAAVAKITHQTRRNILQISISSLQNTAFNAQHISSDSKLARTNHPKEDSWWSHPGKSWLSRVNRF